MAQTPADELAELNRRLATLSDDDERRAELLYDRAELIEEMHGPARALPHYEQAVPALARFPGLTRWAVSAANDVVVLRREAGNTIGASEMAAWVVSRFLEGTPPEAVTPMANSVLVAAAALHEQHRTAEALRLIDRWIDLHGRPGADGHPRTTGRALIERGALQCESGDIPGARSDFERAWRLLEDPSALDVEDLRADAVGRLAEVLGKLGNREEMLRLCHYSVQRWGNLPLDDPPARHVPWARRMLRASR